MIRLAEESDIEQALSFLRVPELSDLASMGINPREELRKLLGPYTYSGLAEDKVVCMWGLRFPPTVEMATMWLIAGPGLAKRKVQFLRGGRKFVGWSMREFGPIQACTRATSAIRWLEWVGFHQVETAGSFVRMQTDA